MTKRARKKENGKRRIHNTAKESKLARIKKKLLGETNWYKKRMDRDDHEKPHIGRKMMSNQGDNLRTRAVLFVEQTPQGELARRMKEQLQRLEATIGFKLRVVERTGRSLQSQLSRGKYVAEITVSRATREESYCHLIRDPA